VGARRSCGNGHSGCPRSNGHADRKGSEDFVIAQHKSAIVVKDQGIGQRLQEVVQGLGIPWKEATKDLGVPLGTGQEVRRIKAGRWFEFVCRMRKIAQLTLQEQWLARFVGSSALGAGAYGTGQDAVGFTNLHQLRRWAAYGIYRGSKAAKTELILAVGTASRGADPVYVVAERVVRFASSTIAAGLRTQQHWRAMVVDAEAGGPFRALREVLAFCSIDWHLEGWRAGSYQLKDPLRAAPCQWRKFLKDALWARDCQVLRGRCGDAITQVDLRAVASKRAAVDLAGLAR
jgi:hypothetical protein